MMARACFSGGAGDDSEKEEPQPKKKSRLRQADSEMILTMKTSEGEGRYHISQTLSFRCTGQAYWRGLTCVRIAWQRLVQR